MPLLIESTDGTRLEASWDVADHAGSLVVLCHPHPRQGGTMNAPLIRSVARYLQDRGATVLRFNFRGVGESGGEWGGGEAEIGDVAGAVVAAAAAYPDLPLRICGWSFGAVTALRWQAESGSTAPYAGIAPPVSSGVTPLLPDPAELYPGRRRFVLGDRDQFVTVREVQRYADSIGADLKVIKGSDHFFHFRDQRVGELVADALGVGP